MENKVRKFTDKLFANECIFESKKQQKDFLKNLKKVREQWADTGSIRTINDSFRETNTKFVSDLKLILKRLGVKSCRRHILTTLKPFIRREVPDIYESGGAYQLYMMKSYMNGFLNEPENYQDMIVSRVVHDRMNEKTKVYISKIVMTEARLFVKIMIKLVEELEKMRASK